MPKLKDATIPVLDVAAAVAKRERRILQVESLLGLRTLTRQRRDELHAELIRLASEVAAIQRPASAPRGHVRHFLTDETSDWLQNARWQERQEREEVAA